jgi:hypothetical protein
VAVTTNPTLVLSVLGSEAEAMTSAQVRSDAVTAAAISLTTCPDGCYQASGFCVRSVVVLEVADSDSIAYQAERWERGT